MSMIEPDDDWQWIAVAALVLLALLVLLAAGCRTQQQPAPVIVDASAIWRCGDHWCVSDGWLATHDSDDAACNQALDECLTALRDCPLP